MHEALFWVLGIRFCRELYVGFQVFCAVWMNNIAYIMPAQVVHRPPELSVHSNEVYYEYTSKNNQCHINFFNKHVRLYAITGSERCLVRLLDMYFSKLPTSPPAF